MNERIKELMLESGFKIFDDKIVAADNGSSGNATICSQKFAELIVRECFGCIDIMEKIAESNNSSIPKDYDKHTYLETLDTMRGLLTTHFGVE